MGILSDILGRIFGPRPKPVPTPTPIPTPTPTPVPVPGDVVAQLLQLHNAARGAGYPLQINPQLQQAAINHCQWMASHDNMSHNEGLKGIGQRATEAGYRWNALGENIAEGQPDAQSVFRAWMRSPGHHANIMNKNFKDVGIALVRDSRGTPYWCVDFGRQG